MTATIRIFNAATNELIAEHAIADNYTPQTLNEIRYAGTLRIESATYPSVYAPGGGDPIQRADVQAIAHELRQISASRTDVLDIIQKDLEYARSEVDYWRGRCQLLESKLILGGVKPPPIPFDREPF